MKLCQQLSRLVRAAESSTASTQYSRGLETLVLWDLKHLYEMSATRATHAAQRYTARLAFLSRDRFAIAQQSPRTRSRVESEFAAYSEHGIEDFEDLYADGFEASDDEDEVTSVHDTSALIDDDVTGYDGDDDDVDRDDVFVERALGGRDGVFWKKCV